MTDVVADTTPVLVGVGAVWQRETDPTVAREPLELMLDAAVAAGRDCTTPELLRGVQAVYVPRGRWRYRDPGRAIAGRLGAGAVHSVLAHVGVLQDQLVATACDRIAAGEIDVALVVGGEAGFRILRSRITGQEISDSQQDSTPDELWRASESIMSDAEIEGGLGKDAPPYYAVIDSAFRHRHGRDLVRHRTALSELYSGFSRIAADNPNAWRRSVVDSADIRESSDKNPMLAFPYTKMHTSDWSVDQASALLLCSARTAREHGVPPDKWVYPLVTSVSNQMISLAERADLGRIPAAEVAARRALDHVGVSADRLDFVDMYSCFPVAVLGHAEAVGLDLERKLTVSGGMRFAGGPFNNYVLHTTAQLADQLRARPDAIGLVSTVSGVLTKHGFGMWSCQPIAQYRYHDVTGDVERTTETKKVEPTYSGSGTVAGYTVVFEKNQPSRGVVVVDTPAGTRTIASTTDERVMASMIDREFTGRSVRVENRTFVPQNPEA